MKTRATRILALIINILGIPAIFLTGKFALEFSIALLFASNTYQTWFLIFVGLCFLMLPILLILAVMSAWSEFGNREYTAALLSYKWVLLDVFIIAICDGLRSSGLVNK